MHSWSPVRLYGAINKVAPQDDGTIRVYGIASSEAVDADGEVVTAEAMREALPDYLRFPTIREMHGQHAAGTVIEIEVGDDNITRIAAHVVDPIAVKKVTAGVYRGFSIGGKALARDPADRNRVTKIALREISLVDRPANPQAVFDCWKAAKIDRPEPQEADALAIVKAALAQPIRGSAAEKFITQKGAK